MMTSSTIVTFFALVGWLSYFPQVALSTGYCTAFGDPGNPDGNIVAQFEQLKSDPEFIEKYYRLSKDSYEELNKGKQGELRRSYQNREDSCPAFDNVDVFIGSGGLGFGYGSINPSGKCCSLCARVRTYRISFPYSSSSDGSHACGTRYHQLHARYKSSSFLRI